MKIIAKYFLTRITEINYLFVKAGLPHGFYGYIYFRVVYFIKYLHWLMPRFGKQPNSFPNAPHMPTIQIGL